MHIRRCLIVCTRYMSVIVCCDRVYQEVSDCVYTVHVSDIVCCDRVYQEVQEKCRRLEHHMGLLREDKSKYKHDVYSLINVISNARSTNRWDVS